MHRAVVQIRDISEARLYCVHTLCETFGTSKEDLTNIIQYHAITRCDAVSDIAGHGKGSAWNAFCSNPDLQATCNIPLLPPQPDTMGWSKVNGILVPTVMPLAPMCRSYHMWMNHMMHLREMWLQKRKHALHKIVQVQIMSRV